MKISVEKLQYEIATNRSEKAFHSLFVNLHTPLIKFCNIYLRNKTVAEEIVSDVLLNIWLMDSKLLEIDDLKLYLFKSVKNKAITYLTKVRKYTIWDIENISVSHCIDNHSPENISIEKEFYFEIMKGIDQLPPQCQFAFKLVREYGFSYKQVALIMNISEKTVDRHIQIALQKLSNILEIKNKK